MKHNPDDYLTTAQKDIICWVGEKLPKVRFRLLDDGTLLIDTSAYGKLDKIKTHGVDSAALGGITGPRRRKSK